MADVGIFAKRLKEARLRKARKLGYTTARGYSQERLGIEAGVEEESASARINQYEKGTRVPDLGMAARLAEALEVPMAFLFCRENHLAELLLLAHTLPPKHQQELVTLAQTLTEQSRD